MATTASPLILLPTEYPGGSDHSSGIREDSVGKDREGNLMTTGRRFLLLAAVGLVTAVDLATNTLVLETRTGPQRVLVATTATIHGDHGAVLSIRDLAPGDAVSYRTASGAATDLRVARQFWAIPREWGP
ncbi:MAG TPA: hypothetical protein VFV05_03245 [Methylomirabilota bacterium]|nr:hypothetical protein [Methylomirabilota bacterium]